jgi:hypothetical protein
VPFVPPARNADGQRRGDIGGAGNDILSIYTPGNSPDIWHPGLAKRIKAGSDLVFQMHYTANGKAGDDRSLVGLIFATEPPSQRVLTVPLGNSDFVIPPGDPNYRVSTIQTISNTGALLSFFPHMHVRGKAFEYRLMQPGSDWETLLKVNNYNFNWQLTYRLEKPIELKEGAKFEVSGWFDNSPNNPFNPNPKAEVRFGEQSWEEMMIGFVDLAIDAKTETRDFYKKKTQPKATD